MTKARQRKNVKVVRTEWLYHSIGKWQRQDESQYLLPDKPGKAPPTSTTPPPQTEGEGEDTGVEDGEDQGSVSEGMDENHQPMSMDKDEITEHLKSVDWDDMEKEVEDFVGDMDDTDADSDARLAICFVYLPFIRFCYYGRGADQFSVALSAGHILSPRKLIILRLFICD